MFMQVLNYSRPPRDNPVSGMPLRPNQSVILRHKEPVPVSRSRAVYEERNHLYSVIQPFYSVFVRFTIMKPRKSPYQVTFGALTLFYALASVPVN